MEVTEHRFDEDVVNVRGKMHLLISGHFESKVHLFQTLQDVDHNFTLIRKAILDRLITERWQAGLLITFCRCQLNRILEEDGITINPSLATLLKQIECHLLDVVGDKKSILGFFYWMNDNLENIKKAYSKPPSGIYSYQLIIRHDQMMEFLNHCLQDVDCFHEYEDKGQTFLKENITLLRNYLELFTKEETHGDNSEELLIALENAAYYMSRYFFCAGMLNYNAEKIHNIKYQFRFQVLKVLVFQSDGFSSSKLVMSEQLVIELVKYVQDNLLELLKNKSTGLTNISKGQLMVLHEGLSFLMHLLITYLSKQENLSIIRLDFQTLATNVGSVICSCFDYPETKEMSLQLFDLLDKINVIKGEIIKTICCIILEKSGKESAKQDQLGSLIRLLQNLREFMDREPDLIVNWKNHQNLLLFIFYLIQYNIRGCSFDDELCRNTTQLDVALISHKEFDEILISYQVVAFNMACHSLLSKHERFRWWELYLGTKENIDMQMCIGTLKAILLSSTTPSLTNELLFAYGECIQDSLIKLLRDADFDPLKDQFNILHEGLSTLVRLLLSYKDELEKVLHIKVGVQDLVWRVASFICLHFSNGENGDTATKQSSTEISNLVEKMNLIIVETKELLCLLNIEKIRRESPKTDPLGSLNIILQNWKGLMECDLDLIVTWKDQFQMIHENLDSFKSFITNSSLDDDESQQLCSSIVDAGYVAEYLLTTLSFGACLVRCRDGWVSKLTKHVELIKVAVAKVDEKRGIGKEINANRKDQGQISAQTSPVPPSIDVVVGFEVEMKLIRERLAGRKQIDVISIIGMPGLGKTTLARKAFEDKYTVKHFDIRAWCCISQEYKKKDLLLTILDCIVELNDEIRRQSAADLCITVHKQLKGRRYFIVLDDVWDIDIYEYLKRFFPDDNQGSRIMLTSRSKVIGSHAKAHCHNDLVEPRLLTDKQSWDLLKQKVYNKLECPPELCEIGKGIAANCKGLPLAVVVVGGVLAKGAEKQEFWEQVMENLSSYLESQFMAALELSYKFLPDRLKPMFLYIGAFPEDKEIYVDKLMRLCLAEGFVQRTESTSLVIQAETNLLDLVDRSLVMVGKRRWDGRVKTCHIHDLLRDMCLVKAKEEKFMHQVRVHDELPDPVMYQRRLNIFLEGNNKTTSRQLNAFTDLPKFSITPPTCSLLFFGVGQEKGEWGWMKRKPDLKPVISSLKLLKVLDAGILSITGDVFDKDLIMLVHLRYLSFYVDYAFKTIPSSISRLRNLETLIIKTDYGQILEVPETIWEMTKLRHLDIYPRFKFSAAPESHFILEKLETLSRVLINVGEEESIFKKVPSLKILECLLGDNDGQFLNFGSLSKLESLFTCSKIKFTGQLNVSSTLKTLDIRLVHMEGSQISKFHTLPNLEVLKLISAFKDEVWDMGEDDVFNNLRVLKLDDRYIKRWSASSENFPKLEKLVFKGCHNLEEIPSDLGEINTLEEIKVTWCLPTLVKLVKEIQKEQEESGYESLKFSFYRNRD